jgi:hypothetical protein
VNPNASVLLFYDSGMIPIEFKSMKYGYFEIHAEIRMVVVWAYHIAELP